MAYTSCVGCVLYLLQAYQHNNPCTHVLPQEKARERDMTYSDCIGWVLVRSCKNRGRHRETTILDRPSGMILLDVIKHGNWKSPLKGVLNTQATEKWCRWYPTSVGKGWGKNPILKLLANPMPEHRSSRWRQSCSNLWSPWEIGCDEATDP